MIFVINLHNNFNDMNIQKDKLWHFLGAILISWIVLLVSHLWFPLKYNWDFGLAFAVAFICVVLKEIVWDKWLKMGTPELMDFFWGFVGAIVGPAIWMIVELILGKADQLPW